MDKSLWISSIKKKKYKGLEKDETADVCIIGGGLTGLTTAYYLSENGKKVIVLEKNEIGSHTSGNTTAKITSQHGLFYKYLIDSQGEEKARQYLYANEEAIRNIEEIIKKENIECDFEKQDSYVFTKEQDKIKNIKEEVEAVNKLGFNAEYVEGENVPIKGIIKGILGAIKFPNQAQFNPCKYMQGLANAIESYKGIIYENTKAIGVDEEENNYCITTQNGKKVYAKYVVIATHYPFIKIKGFYFMKMYQETSYLIGVETDEELFDGMYIESGKQTTSLRTAKYGDKRILLVGGMNHKTGAKIDLKNSYKELEKIAKQLYPKSKMLFWWNTQDCISLDKIPYIGDFSILTPNMYVATGYKKWGMTSSNVAANIITNKILKKENKYEEVFKSTRLKPIKNYEELKNMTKEVSYSLVINKLKDAEELLNDVKKDEGKIVEIEGKKVGVYKNNEGEIFTVNPICTHLGCELSWNNLDKTWDCPCHGSRFNYDGKSLYDPAIEDLET